MCHGKGEPAWPEHSEREKEQRRYPQWLIVNEEGFGFYFKRSGKGRDSMDVFKSHVLSRLTETVYRKHSA